MQTSPPPTRPSSRVLFGTPNGTPNGTPKRTRNDGLSSDEEDALGTSGHSFSLKGMLSPGRGGVPVSSGPPPAPFKPRVKKSFTNDPEEPLSNALPGLPILAVVWSFIGSLGAGSFGTVDKVVFPPPPGSLPGTPCSPPVAMKTVKQSLQQGPKTLLQEADGVGSQGCASGVAATDENGNLFLFTSIATPLSQMRQIGFNFLEQVISMAKDAIMKAPLSVVFDCKPDNLGCVRKGEATVIADANGQPCAGPVTDSDSVVVLDLGRCHSPEEAEKNFNPLLDDEALETEEQQTKFREFKCEMMEALLRNQFADMSEDENRIVARICAKYGWVYAAGVQYQPEFSQ